ncbi:unnamed protein product [Protopolystoma xenopodis]|uniref:DNA methyltransferase 2 n=1 Tax=Protopolystoma xenopodis TaxID=117903 RepID=A0A3S5AF37_9PLAT|nr:unnamed protein product [Protopolystoma xenopodis]
MKVFELYSGIGGIHYALRRSKISYEVILAIDINDTATKVYKHNFSHTRVVNREIQNLSAQECDKLFCDLWTMSPPCQPYTRLGNKKGGEDNRSSSFFHLLDVISSVKPSCLFIENVHGFEGTDAWCCLINLLVKCGYEYRFGVPNSRLRYYLMARIKGLPPFTFPHSSNSRAGSSLGCNSHPDLSYIYYESPESVSPLPECSCPQCHSQIRLNASELPHYSAYSSVCNDISTYLLCDDKISEDRNSL